MIRITTDKEIPGVLWRSASLSPTGVKYLYVLPEAVALKIAQKIGGAYEMQAAAE